jgi:hypothetical protein
MTLIEVHAVVEQAIATLMTLRDKWPAEIGDDTARTIGRGLGLIDNGRLLLERDIRQMRSGKP